MKRVNGWFFFGSLFLESIVVLMTIGISVHILGEKMVPIGSPTITLIIWFVLVFLSTPLIYQTWGCVETDGKNLFPSNWRTDKAVAIAYLAINILSVWFAFIVSTTGYSITKTFNNSFEMNIADFLFIAIVAINFIGWPVYAQSRRNSVRDFISENDGSFDEILTETNAKECL